MKIYLGYVESNLPQGAQSSQRKILALLASLAVSLSPMGVSTSSAIQTAKPSSAAPTSAPAPPTPTNSTWTYGFTVTTLPLTLELISTAAKASGATDWHTHPCITRSPSIIKTK